MKTQTHKINGKIYITNGELPKQNTNTFSQGINGDWFVNTKHKFISQIVDITPFDFKVVLTNDSNLKQIQQLTPQEVELIESGVVFEVEQEKCCGCRDVNGDCVGNNCPLPKGYKLILKQETLESLLKQSDDNDNIILNNNKEWFNERKPKQNQIKEQSLEEKEKWEIEINRLDKLRLDLRLNFNKLEQLTGIFRGQLKRILECKTSPSLKLYLEIKDALESQIEVEFKDDKK